MIKFYFNGMRVNGELYKGYWRWSQDVDGNKRITFYAEGYSRLPQEVREVFKVQNDTDIMTDYFEEDRFRVAKDHPLFKQVAEAVIKKLKRDLKRNEKWEAPSTPASIANRQSCIDGITQKIKELMKLAA